MKHRKTVGVSEPRVLRSAAGYYIGTIYVDPESGCVQPNSRDSEYYISKDKAEAELALTLVNN